MIKLPVNYTDFDDNAQSTVIHLHLSKRELLDLNIEDKQSRFEVLQKIFEQGEIGSKALANAVKEYVSIFEEIILLAYGIRSEDGQRFVKSDAIREDLPNTAWYGDWLFELAQDPERMASILQQLVPKDLRQQAQSELRKPTDYLAPQTSSESKRVESPEEMEARIRAELSGN